MGRLVAEVEALQALDDGEARQVGAHRDVLRNPGGDLLREDDLEEVGVGELLASRSGAGCRIRS